MRIKRIVQYLKKHKGFIRFFNIQFLSAILTVLVGKITAIYFTPKSFGEYAIISSIFAFFGSVIATPLIQSYRFIYHKYEYLKLNNYYFSIFTWFIFSLWCLFIFLFLTFDVSIVISSICILTLLFQTYQSVLGAGLNLRGYNNKYAIISLSIPISTLFIILISVYFLNKREFYILLIANAFAQFAVFLLFSLSIKENKKIKIYKIKSILTDVVSNEIFLFIRPLLLLPIYSWVVISGDKFLIKYYIGDHAVGLYSASYSIGSKIFLTISGIIILYLNTSIYKEISTGINLIEIRKKIIRRSGIYFMIGSGITFLIHFFSDTIGYILLSEQYKEGFHLISLLSFASLIMTCFFFGNKLFMQLD